MMQTIEMHNPKCDWVRELDGPWTDEPDKIQWPDADTGLPCLIVRQDAFGSLCGYVGVPPEHPFHECGYDDLYDLYDVPSVHGGLTFSGSCQVDEHGPIVETVGRVCHVPDPGEPHDVWWFGFDAAHYGDFSPYRISPRYEGIFGAGHMSTYRDVPYIKTECRYLARWLHKAAA